jgi:glycosyltransferase involved in cell wall biosynthesis
LDQGLRWRLEALLIPDAGVAWLPFAAREGLAAVRRYKPAVIYATAPPFSTLCSAWLVAKMSRLPLVVDLRDLWVDNPTKLIARRLKRRIEKILECIVLSGSAAVLTTAQSSAELLRTKYQRSSEKIFTIYNGFEEKDFSSQLNTDKCSRNGRIFTISHMGSLYANITPVPFLVGLKTFVDKLNKSKSGKGIEVRFVGQTTAFREEFEKHDGVGVLKIEDPVEHPVAVEIMKQSDVLLLIMADNNQRVIPAKLFEYLATGRPILGIVPLDGEVAELLQQAGNAWVVDVGDAEGIARCLSDIHEKWSAGELVSKTNQEYVGKFERRYLTSQLCDVFVSVASTECFPDPVA